MLGGWQLSLIATARTSIPVQHGGGPLRQRGTGLAIPQTQRPDLISSASLIPAAGATVADWINLGAFAVPANGTFGNAGRNLVPRAGIWQADISLGKEFRVKERALSVEFLASAFNLFNRAQEFGFAARPTIFERHFLAASPLR